MLLQQETREARSWAPDCRSFFRMSGRDFEGLAEISNVERLAAIPNIQPKFRMLEAWNVGKVKTSYTFRVFREIHRYPDILENHVARKKTEHLKISRVLRSPREK